MLYFFSPLKYSFKEVKHVACVVIIEPNKINANTTLKIGLIAMATSANGIWQYASLGLNKKHNIPSVNKMHNTKDVKMLVWRLCFAERLPPIFIITNELKNVFCDTYAKLNKGKGSMFFIPKFVVKEPELKEQITFNIMHRTISGTTKFESKLKFLKEVFERNIVITRAIKKYSHLCPLGK